MRPPRFKRATLWLLICLLNVRHTLAAYAERQADTLVIERFPLSLHTFSGGADSVCVPVPSDAPRCLEQWAAQRFTGQAGHRFPPPL